jgi:hypothetical protein
VFSEGKKDELKGRALLLFGAIASGLLGPVHSAFAGHTSGSVSGTLVSQTDGACDAGYSSFCPSGDCICDFFSGVISGNPIGKGSAKLWATVDEGAALSTGSTCFPVFGSLDISTSRDVEIIDTAGSSCNTNNSINTLSGGFGIAQSAVGASAWGSVTGTFIFPPEPVS